jgi:hypothetical protein
MKVYNMQKQIEIIVDQGQFKTLPLAGKTEPFVVYLVYTARGFFFGEEL